MLSSAVSSVVATAVAMMISSDAARRTMSRVVVGAPAATVSAVSPTTCKHAVHKSKLTHLTASLCDAYINETPLESKDKYAENTGEESMVRVDINDKETVCSKEIE